MQTALKSTSSTRMAHKWWDLDSELNASRSIRYFTSISTTRNQRRPVASASPGRTISNGATALSIAAPLPSALWPRQGAGQLWQRDKCPWNSRARAEIPQTSSAPAACAAPGSFTSPPLSLGLPDGHWWVLCDDAETTAAATRYGPLITRRNA